MYDEIQRLKGLIAAFTKEKSLRMTKITKLEKELSKKVRFYSFFIMEGLNLKYVFLE